MFKILFFVTALCAIYCEATLIPIIIYPLPRPPPPMRAKRQLSGGVPSFPGGGTNQFGGSIFRTPNHDLSASGWRTGSSYGGGVDWTAPRGSLSLGGSHAPPTSSFMVGSSASIYKTPDHNVNLFGSHTRGYDTNFKPLGSSSTAGLGYQYTNKDSNLKLGLNGGVQFGGGQKPSPFAGFSLVKRFR